MHTSHKNGVVHVPMDSYQLTLSYLNTHCVPFFPVMWPQSAHFHYGAVVSLLKKHLEERLPHVMDR